MTVDVLLSRLDRVRRTGPGKWMARCPAHDDTGPSLSVRELDDGRALVHDFGGCSVEDVLGAIGLELADLFPDRQLGDRVKRERRPFDPRDVLAALAGEARIAAVAASNARQGTMLSDEDFERLLVAAERLEEGRRLACGEC